MSVQGPAFYGSGAPLTNMVPPGGTGFTMPTGSTKAVEAQVELNLAARLSQVVHLLETSHDLLVALYDGPAPAEKPSAMVDGALMGADRCVNLATALHERIQGLVVKIGRL